MNQAYEQYQVNHAKLHQAEFWQHQYELDELHQEIKMLGDQNQSLKADFTKLSDENKQLKADIAKMQIKMADEYNTATRSAASSGSRWLERG